jgi:hypothetical protein
MAYDTMKRAPPRNLLWTIRRSTSTTPVLIFVDAVIDPATGTSLEYDPFSSGPDNADGIQTTANEMGHLTQFNLPQTMCRTKNMHFLSHKALSAGRHATDLRIIITSTGSWITNDSPP